MFHHVVKAFYLSNGCLFGLDINWRSMCLHYTLKVELMKMSASICVIHII